MRTLPLIALALTIGLSAPSRADTFTLNTNGGDGFVTFAPGIGFDLFGSNSGSDLDILTTYTAVALSPQTFTVNWIYHTDDIGAVFDPAGYLLNGVEFPLTAPNGADQSGSFSVSVLTGDIYGVYVETLDDQMGRANIIVTASETPLPAAFPLFASGVGALGLSGWRRKKKAQQTPRNRCVNSPTTR